MGIYSLSPNSLAQRPDTLREKSNVTYPHHSHSSRTRCMCSVIHAIFRYQYDERTNEFQGPGLCLSFSSEVWKLSQDASPWTIRKKNTSWNQSTVLSRCIPCPRSMDPSHTRATYRVSPLRIFPLFQLRTSWCAGLFHWAIYIYMYIYVCGCGTCAELLPRASVYVYTRAYRYFFRMT